MKEENPEYFMEEHQTYSAVKKSKASGMAGDGAIHNFTAAKPTKTIASTVKKKAKASGGTASFLKNMKKARKKDDDIDIIMVSQHGGDAEDYEKAIEASLQMNENPNTPAEYRIAAKK